jgi:hypothetical protein
VCFILSFFLTSSSSLVSFLPCMLYFYFSFFAFSLYIPSFSFFCDLLFISFSFSFLVLLFLNTPLFIFLFPFCLRLFPPFLSFEIIQSYVYFFLSLICVLLPLLLHFLAYFFYFFDFSKIQFIIILSPTPWSLKHLLPTRCSIHALVPHNACYCSRYGT